VVLKAARFESDAVSLRALSLAQSSSSYMSLTSLKTIPQGTKHSLYADDLAWSSSPDQLKGAHSVQKAPDHIEEWSLKWRFPVNPAKCESCCFFNTDPHQASH